MISRRGFLGLGLAGLLFPARGLALEPGQESRTALAAARYRAAHQLLESPRVFHDPLALPILGKAEAARLEADLESQRGAGARAMRAFIVMRSRFAEDALAQAVAAGVGQYVVLGAGLDTFGCRNPYPGLRVYEVDHPATQARKRARLVEAGIAAPGSLTFAPVDFERRSLAEGLAAAGFRREAPAFYSLLGVSIYLTEPALLGTLGFVAAGARGSGIAFDFAPPPGSLEPAERAAFEARAASVAAIGEPWVGFHGPDALAGRLRGLGFATAEHSGSAELNARYFAGRADGFGLAGSGRMMLASLQENR